MDAVVFGVEAGQYIPEQWRQARKTVGQWWLIRELRARVWHRRRAERSSAPRKRAYFTLPPLEPLIITEQCTRMPSRCPGDVINYSHILSALPKGENSRTCIFRIPGKTNSFG